MAADGGTLPPLNLTLHEQQSNAFLSAATEILYGGAAGGGKSHLLRIMAIALASDVPGIQIYLFRRLSDDLYKNHMTGPGGFFALLAPFIDSKLVRYNVNKNCLEFWNNARIWLCHCQYEKDVLKYQGSDIHVLLMDELTHFTSTIYRFLRSRVRLGGLKVPEKLKGRLPLVLAGSNPGGVGHNWVKSGWISRHKPMEIWRAPTSEGGMLRQFIPALLSDNPTMSENDPDYADRLEGLGNPTLVQAMREGDWDIVSGGALDDVWSPRIILPRFKLPYSWSLNRSYDWGSSKPFSVLWWAEADGSQATIPHPKQDYKFSPPPGSLILFHEWYGGDPKKPNAGLKMPAKAIAQGIRAREQMLMAEGWAPNPIEGGPADSAIFSGIPGQDTIAQEMEDCGVFWTPANKSPGTRKIGLDLFRARLLEAGKDHPENRGLWIMDHCVEAITHWPVLPRDPSNEDDVDSGAEDHDYDAARYRILEVNSEADAEDLPY